MGAELLPTDLAFLPCGACRSECCYNVPVRDGELRRILKAIRSWPEEERRRLDVKPRPQGMCPFVDVEHWRCSVHHVRPILCRLYGHTPGMECPLVPRVADEIPRDVAHRRMDAAASAYGPPVGVLGADLTWDQILQ